MLDNESALKLIAAVLAETWEERADDLITFSKQMAETLQAIEGVLSLAEATGEKPDGV